MPRKPSDLPNFVDPQQVTRPGGDGGRFLGFLDALNAWRRRLAGLTGVTVALYGVFKVMGLASWEAAAAAGACLGAMFVARAVAPVAVRSMNRAGTQVIESLRHEAMLVDHRVDLRVAETDEELEAAILFARRVLERGLIQLQQTSVSPDSFVSSVSLRRRLNHLRRSLLRGANASSTTVLLLRGSRRAERRDQLWEIVVAAGSLDSQRHFEGACWTIEASDAIDVLVDDLTSEAQPHKLHLEWTFAEDRLLLIALSDTYFRRAQQRTIVQYVCDEVQDVLDGQDAAASSNI